MQSGAKYPLGSQNINGSRTSNHSKQYRDNNNKFEDENNSPESDVDT